MNGVNVDQQQTFMNPTYTERQGQFLAYIHQYSIVNGCAPAEADMQRFFQITPPSVHSMVLTLERRGLIRRVPGQARSITLIVSPESLPPLKRVQPGAIQTMKNATKKPGGWSAVRQQLATWEKPELLALVKDLYEVAAENRDFIQARSKAGEGGGETLEKYRGKIVEQFFPARGDGKLKLGEARKAIRDYRKATGNLPGTAELLMTYVENGAQFTHEFGDIDERFYNSVESVLEELAALLRGEARELYPQFSDRLAKVEQMTDGIGWGFHDFVADIVGQLEEELGGR